MPALRSKSPYRSKNSTTDPRHLMRFLKAQGGLKIEEIAKSEGVGLKTVRDSIRMVESHRSQNTQFEMELAMRNVFISSAPKAKIALDGLLTATELVEKKIGETGKTKVIEVQDKTTRLEALKVFNSLAQTMQPKVPLIENKINNSNQVAVLTPGVESNEERLRRIRKKAEEFNALPPEVAAVPQYLDKGEDAPDDDEDEDDDDSEDEDE